MIKYASNYQKSASESTMGERDKRKNNFQKGNHHGHAHRQEKHIFKELNKAKLNKPMIISFSKALFPRLFFNLVSHAVSISKALTPRLFFNLISHAVSISKALFPRLFFNLISHAVMKDTLLRNYAMRAPVMNLY
ncbi:hypothetical protein C5167_039693 [Papaver somniferum]|uniref:Uncharacterized protein n=1 Tax=Papaver somniferum TaxID=3469 RepID=A0A4Y7ICU4_PAPSO|nr:hypothetical protein C5167_039693 [Papaver somniferum]